MCCSILCMVEFSGQIGLFILTNRFYSSLVWYIHSLFLNQISFLPEKKTPTIKKKKNQIVSYFHTVGHFFYHRILIWRVIQLNCEVFSGKIPNPNFPAYLEQKTKMCMLHLTFLFSFFMAFSFFFLSLFLSGTCLSFPVQGSHSRTGTKLWIEIYVSFYFFCNFTQLEHNC